MLEQMLATMVARLRYEAAATRMMVALRALGGTIADQPRIPAGNPDGGQWTAIGSEGETLVASAGGWELPGQRVGVIAGD